MIINISRVKTRGLCRRKSLNNYHRGLTSPGRSMNLVDGGAFHKGVAAGLATKDWGHALRVAQEGFEEEMKGVALLPELEFQLEDHKVLIEKMIQCYQEAFADQGIQVVQPECEFDVPLEGTEHSCIWLHHLEIDPSGVYLEEKWGPPSAQAILDQRVRSPHETYQDFLQKYQYIPKLAEECKCYTPHRFVGKTDAVVVWMNNIWLLEHKTTAISGEKFWRKQSRLC